MSWMKATRLIEAGTISKMLLQAWRKAERHQ